MQWHIRRCWVFIILIVMLAQVPAGAHAMRPNPPPATGPIWIDSDGGVGDTTAIALLLQGRADIVGISTVFGNTSVENAANNALTVLDVAGRRDIPVVIGAAAPRVFAAPRTGAFIHGPDGLWNAQVPHDLSTLSRDVPAAIAAAALAHPGLTVLSLGPTTNIAATLERFPTAMEQVRLVSVAGTRGPGNQSALAEANVYWDPQSFRVVLERSANLTMLPIEVFDRARLNPALPDQLARRGNAFGRFLAQPIAAFMVASNTGGPRAPVAVPDATAAIYILHPESFDPPTSALVVVTTDAGLHRGQTTIATDLTGRLGILAHEGELDELVDRLFNEPGFDIYAALGAILARQPDNAGVVFSNDARAVERAIVQGLTQ